MDDNVIYVYLGWWMILREDEQGYAPAAHLEAVDKTYDTLETVECSSNEGIVLC